MSAKYVRRNPAHTINHFICALINCLQPQGAAFHLCIREITCSWHQPEKGTPKHIGYTKAKGSADKTNSLVDNDIYEASFPRELHLMTVRFLNRIIPKLQASLKQSIRESREKINMHVYHDRLQVRLAPYWTLLNPTGIHLD